MRFFTNPQHKGWMRTQPKRMSSSAVMLENTAHELLIVKTNYKKYWSLPGGIVDQNETPKQAAVREVAEEIGITLDPVRLVFVAVVDRISNEAQTYQFIFSAPISADDIAAITLQRSEIVEYAFVSKAQVLSGDRNYAKAIYAWANDVSGYIEQTFGKGQ